MDTEPERILPNEIWIESFQSLDRHALKALRMVCRSFCRLSWDVILRDITWSNSSRAVAATKYWERNPAHTCLPRDLLVSVAAPPIRLEDSTKPTVGDEDDEDTDHFTADQVMRIFDRVRSFSNLEALTIDCAYIPTDFRDILRELPILKQLTLNYCALPLALSQLPVRPSRLPTHISNVTSLKVSLVKPEHLVLSMDPVPCAGLLSLLPRLRTLHIERCFLATDVFPSGITSLTIEIPCKGGEALAEGYLCEVLRLLPRLRSLTAFMRDENPSRHNPTHAFSPYHTVPPSSLPHLTDYTGTADLGLVALAASPIIEDIRAQGKSERIIQLIEFLGERNAPVRSLSVELPLWSSAAARVISRYFPQCERLEITYAGTGTQELGKLDLTTCHNLEDVVIKQDSHAAKELIEFLAERNAPVRRVSVQLPVWTRSTSVVRSVFRLLPRCEHLEITTSADAGKWSSSPPPLRLNHVVIKQDSERAIDFIELLQELNMPVRRLSLELPFWSTTVVRAVSHCIPRCERLEITYAKTGTAELGTLVLSVSHVLEDIVIKQDSQRAIEIIEFLEERSAPVRRLSVELPVWNTAVVRSTCLSLPQCERLEITYARDQPSEESLVELGTEFIPHLVHLREISILHVPRANVDEHTADSIKETVQEVESGPEIQIVAPLVDDSRKLSGLDGQLMVEPEVAKSHKELVELEDAEDEMNLRGILHCWTRYNHNLALQRICLSGSGPTKWVRERDWNDAKKWTTTVV
ncbi:hypothetical protein B0H17DRAFT_1338541 [Mycena rosella]|uniref:F-box domain-containing protein n=1 Tax=Mycena rosella TaxID=1033263 RepID=A0AAD7G3F1_MYCRO|nr:hypothetical protein B0H17DRAFT_1338541 [Mycena rosella]